MRVSILNSQSGGALFPSAGFEKAQSYFDKLVKYQFSRSGVIPAKAGIQ
jgi:hypothetical protein